MSPKVKEYKVVNAVLKEVFDLGMKFSSLMTVAPSIPTIQHAVMSGLLPRLNSLDVDTPTERARVAALVDADCRAWAKEHSPEYLSAALAAEAMFGFFSRSFVGQFSNFLVIKLTASGFSLWRTSKSWDRIATPASAVSHTSPLISPSCAMSNTADREKVSKRSSNHRNRSTWSSLCAT